MKRIFLILLCLSALVIPTKTEAKSFDFSGYYCDSKQSQNDGTFLLTCHIVVKTDYNINHVAGKLHLKNVTLKEIRTKSDWKSNNGLSSDVDFTSATTHMGSMTVADLIFTGNLSDTECTASFEPLKAEEIVTTPTTPEEPNPVCGVLDNEFYGKNGTKVTEEKYYEECYNYVCTVVDNKYYYNSEGKAVSYDVFLEDCSSDEYIPATPNTGIDYGYIVLPLGIISLIVIKKLAHKNTKIYKI